LKECGMSSALHWRKQKQNTSFSFERKWQDAVDQLFFLLYCSNKVKKMYRKIFIPGILIFLWGNSKNVMLNMHSRMLLVLLLHVQSVKVTMILCSQHWINDSGQHRCGADLYEFADVGSLCTRTIFFPSARSMCEDNTNKGGIAQDGSRMAQIVKMNIPRNCALSRDPKHISLELQRRVTGQVQKLVA
jgi:hypothetical protein